MVGCGLDSRIQRLGKVAEKAIFYELDIEEVINLRKLLIPKVSNEYFISSSMLDTKWMSSLNEKHKGSDFIFVIEGVLMYFNENDNKFVFTELANHFNNAEIHFDMLNRWMSTKSKMHDTVSKTNAKFSFGIDDDKEIEKWHPKLKHDRTYLFQEFKGYQRMGLFLTSLMKLIPVFKTSSRFITYKIAEK